MPYAFALQRDDTELLAQVNEQLLALQRDGTLRRLRTEWLQRVPQPEAGGGSLWWLAAGLLCLAFGSGAWWLHHKQLRRRFAEQSRPLSLATFNKFIDMPLAFEGHPFNRWSEPASIVSGES